LDLYEVAFYVGISQIVEFTINCESYWNFSEITMICFELRFKQFSWT